MKTIVVTGASQGIGLATAKRFLEGGWNVMMAARHDDHYADLKEKYGDRVAFTKTDVAELADVKNLHQRTEEAFGKTDVIFNNAGILIGGQMHKIKEADWDRLMNVNVKSIYYMVKTFVPEMIESKSGVIINTSSISGLRGDYNMALYNTSKGAVTNMTRAMALDYGKYGIRVVAVNPGATMTPMLEDGLGDRLEKFIQRSPMKRLIKAEDIANTVYFLASDGARSINGANIPVTTGFEVHTGQPTD